MLARLFCVLLVVSAADTDDKLEEYFEAGEQHRAAAQKKAKEQVDEAKRNLAAARDGTVNAARTETRVDANQRYYFPSQQEKERIIRQLEAEANDKQRALSGILDETRPMILTHHVVSESGIGVMQFRVVQKVDDNNAIGSWGGSPVWVEGARAFANVADGQSVFFPMMRFEGTKTYQSAGGQRTAILARPVDMDDASRKYVRWIAARKARQQERDAEKAKMDHDKAVEKDRQTKIAATEQREKNAADALRGARFLLENGNAAKARERLEQVLKDYPGTAAAKEAEGLLKTLK